MALQLERYPLNPDNDTMMRMFIATIGPHSQTRFHSHYMLEVAVIVSGQGECSVDGHRFPIETGDVLLFNNDEVHAIVNTSDTPMVNVAFEFEPRFVWGNPGFLSDRAFSDVFFNRNECFTNKIDRQNPAYPAIWRQIVEIIAAFKERPQHCEAIIHARLLSLFAELIQHYDIINPSTKSAGRRYVDMERVLNYIGEHYAEAITMERLAGIMHMNKTYFSRVFREVNGISPKEYIVKTRIAAATDLLKDTRREIVDISQACGFNSLSNFYSAFQRITGQTPVSYRQHPLD